jgi:hypothetical protein
MFEGTGRTPRPNPGRTPRPNPGRTPRPQPPAEPPAARSGVWHIAT